MNRRVSEFQQPSGTNPVGCSHSENSALPRQTAGKPVVVLARLRYAAMALAACLAIALPLVACGSTLELEVSGDLLYTLYLPKDFGTKKVARKLEEVMSFKVTAADCRWLIRTSPRQESFPFPIEYWEDGFDGETLFELGKRLRGQAAAEANLKRLEELGLPEPPKSMPRPPPSATAVSNTNAGADAIGMIYSDCLPTVSPHRMMPLWLAYCSGYYFATNTPGFARQVWESPTDYVAPETNLVKASWSMTAGPMPLLTNLTYYIPSSGRNSNSWTDLPQVMFTALEVTNVQGIIVPTKVTLTRYLETYAEKKERPTIISEFTCTAKQITIKEAAPEPHDFRPKVNFSVWTGDSRFVQDRSVTVPMAYLITNGIWPSKLAAKALPAFRHAVLTSRANAKDASKSWIFTSMFAGAALLVPLLLVFSIRRFRKQQIEQ